LQIVLAGTDHGQRLSVSGAPRIRHRNLALAAQVGAGDRLARGLDIGRRPLGHEFPAVTTRSRSQIDNMVGGANRLLVVLDDQHRVPEITKPLQGLEQPTVVSLVEPNRRLVENVQDTDQPAADLSRQPDPLGLAASQCSGRPLEGQVVEPDRHQKRQSVADLLEDLVPDLALA
jgi:hypothetical protein